MEPARPRIRPAAPSDVEAVIALTEAVASEGRWIGRELPIDHDVTRTRFLAGVTEPGHLSLVAAVSEPVVSEPDGTERVIGHLHLGVAPYGVADLGMQIRAEWRGQGVGRALMTAAVEWARAQPGVHKISLQVWPHNEAALGLYRSAGFEQEGYLHRHYRRRSGELWDAVIMGLALPDEDQASPGGPDEA
jgi:RimJ/RimL family protein N-acetyltransferase